LANSLLFVYLVFDVYNAYMVISIHFDILNIFVSVNALQQSKYTWSVPGA